MKKIVFSSVARDKIRLESRHTTNDQGGIMFGLFASVVYGT